MKIKKKGDITTEQIVIFIILIVSFAVILFFIFRLNLGNTTDVQVCHNSVVERGSGVIPKESIPLDCKTHYLCLSKDGTCESMTSPEIFKVANKNDVYKTLADEMSNCWWEFGEGKVNYVGSEFFSNLYCSICSQVAFDNSLDFFNNSIIDKGEFYNYLAITNDSGKSMTYLNYLLGIKNSQTLQQSLSQNKSSFGQINLSKQYLVVMGIFSKVGVTEWAASAGATGASIGLIFGGPIGMIIGGAIGGGGGFLIATAVSGGSGYQYLSPTIIEANSAQFNSLNCSSIKTLA